MHTQPGLDCLTVYCYRQGLSRNNGLCCLSPDLASVLIHKLSEHAAGAPQVCKARYRKAWQHELLQRAQQTVIGELHPAGPAKETTAHISRHQPLFHAMPQPVMSPCMGFMVISQYCTISIACHYDSVPRVDVGGASVRHLVRAQDVAGDSLTLRRCT